MATSLTIEQRIQRLLDRSTGVKSVTTDGTRTDEHPIGDQLDLIRFAATQDALSKGFTGLRQVRMPGSTTRGAT